MANEINRIAVMTSGGDSPGMNAAIRAVVRTALNHNIEIYGVRQAYLGLVNGDFERMTSRSVSGIIQQGGTILQTARLPEFREDSYQRKAIRRLNEGSIDGLIVIGGDGSLTAAHALAQRGVRVVGIPASIDNDIWGTASAIGVDTALNTIIDCVDRLRDTASSHERVFLVEVMGRSCGYLAVVSGLVTGAEIVLIPEQESSLEEMGTLLEEAYLKGKSHGLVIVAEGANLSCQQIVEYLTKHHDIGFETRVTILGHIQRGGRPSAADRLLGTRFGVSAVEAMLQGKSGVMMALEGTTIVARPLEEVVGKQRPINPQYADMAEVLGR